MFAKPLPAIGEPTNAVTTAITRSAGDRAGEIRDASTIIFVDAGIDYYQSLFDELSLGDGVQVVLLDSARDGLRQISETLALVSQVSDVHIFSHGDEGRLTLGNSSLSYDNLDAYADQIRGWRESLSDDADILLYGCNVAAGEWGVEFVHEFAALSGADIAASNDLTGASLLGGDWNLEYRTGDVESTVLFAGVQDVPLDFVLIAYDGDQKSDKKDEFVIKGGCRHAQWRQGGKEV